MKKILLIAFLATSTLSYAQIFGDSQDKSISIGATFVDSNVGINFIYDKGVGRYLSVGAFAAYLLDSKKVTLADGSTEKLKFGDRIELKARLNIHLGKVIDIDDNFDIYPGINLGLNNFGFHLGSKYKFADGFAVYGQLDTPISKYDDSKYKSFNKTSLSLGVVLELF